jgi:dethiobiotin synthetase
MKPIEDICVVGTDTGVGKSVVSLLLMQLLFAKGYGPFYFKPFQTGCRNPCAKQSDAGFVYAHTAGLMGQDPAQSMLYCHPHAKAPYFAARDAGETIDAAKVQHQVLRKKRHYSPLVIEAAGGLLVPVTPALLMVDLVRMLDCRPLLVARAGLGTINHTLLSIEAMRQRQIEPLGVVFVETDPLPTDAQLVSENRAAVEAHAHVPVAGVIDHFIDFSAPPAAVYADLEKLLF